MKLVEAPGASVAMTIIGTAPLRLFLTTTLVKVMLPEFRTTPVKVRVSPARRVIVGQSEVTSIWGAVSGHVLVASALTAAPVQASLALAVTIEAIVQSQLVLTLKLPVKLALAPGARIAVVKTAVEPLWLFSTA